MKIYIAGRYGMVGRAIEHDAQIHGFHIFGKSSRELDLTKRELVFDEIGSTSPDVLVIAAAKVGGIQANSRYPVSFLSENLQIQTNLIDAAHHFAIPKLIFLGSSCAYPKFSDQPIKESSLLMGPLEPTNKAYAVAKIAGVKLVEAYREQFGHDWLSLMPTNLYGKFDNFEIENSHVLPSLLMRFHKAVVSKTNKVEVWGDGSPLREFLNVSDLAAAIMFLIKDDTKVPILNIGSGIEISIKDLAALIAKITNFKGTIEFDSIKPNGTPRKLLDSSNIRALGWEPKVSLEVGVNETYNWLLNNAITPGGAL